ncbi:uncharacterized protein LOC118439512 [Folsomia candida]|uniref:uncharacterized protein LOC118439512 n=1 Tax=Folsomia candida TaxID=158441 RepID=UPI001604DF2C|nr:uncharacterized protein LOC118439512 [Folsomia candida]
MESSMDHLISRLPEIISKIMEFLLTSDLESISLVNSTWEKEALRHLLIRNPVDVHLHNNVTDSKDLIPLKNLSPTRLNIVVSQPEENAEMILLPKIQLFITINFTTVTKLSINIFLDSSFRHVASRSAKIYESFKNLSCLEFQMVLVNHKELFSSDQDWDDLLPATSINPQKLTTLTLNMSDLIRKDQVPQCDNFISLTTRLLTVFRGVKSLKMIDTPGSGLLQEDDPILPHLTSISFIRTFQIEKYGPLLRFFQFKAPLAPTFDNITRFEFNVSISDATNGSDLLRLLAPQLEHVCISGVDNTYPDSVSENFCTIPILPRLKVFEILREKVLYNCYEINWFRPGLHLNFETEQDEVKLVYKEQFPVLERLIVRLSREPILAWVKECDLNPDENLHFETTMLLLYETFLAEGVAPCGTLRNLDISFPSGDFDVGSMVMKWRRGGDDLWGWEEDVPDFYERISTIFPNLDYHVVMRGKAVVRGARLQKFVEMGVSLEIFSEEGCVYSDFAKIFNAPCGTPPDVGKTGTRPETRVRWVCFVAGVMIGIMGVIYEVDLMFRDLLSFA